MRYLITLPLILGGSAGVVAAGLLSAPRASIPSGDYEELTAAYDEAVAEWKKTFDATEDLRERSALRKKHPAIDHWARFQALADGGEGRAFLWMLGHVRDRGLKRDERGEVLRGLYARIFSEHGDAKWLASAVQRMPRDVRDIGIDSAVEFLESVQEGAADRTARAFATLNLGEILSSSEDAEQKKRGEELLAAYERDNIAVGATAIDFDASTIDGHEFQLSDYRGKAVLVDFYGFW